LIGNYPNTYTFSKAYCERLLEKDKEHVTLTVVRAPSVGCSWADPFPGWIDSISAASGFYLFGGMGLIKSIRGDPNVIGDQIPVDYVGDYMITAAAVYAKTGKVKVIHCSTSAGNPITWGESMEIVKSYFIENPPDKKVAPCTFRLEKNERILKLEQGIRLIPVLAYRTFSKTIDSQQMKKNSNKLLTGLKRAERMSEMFKYFTLHEWIHLNNSLAEIIQFCTDEEKRIFHLDPREIQWKKYLLYHAWGLRYFILKEKCDAPAQGDKSNVLATSGNDIVSALKWMYNKGYEFKPTNVALLRSRILNSERLKNTIRDIVVNQSTNMSDADFTAKLQKHAEMNCDFILSTYDFKKIRFIGLIMHLVFRQIYDKIVVDEKALEKIKNYDPKTGGPLILLPTHRSYLDFILVSYIFYAYAIKCPHIVAAEDFLNIALVHHLLRAAGALFLRRKKIEYMEIYWAVMNEYLQSLLLEECWLEFFIEGTRSRYGKTLSPKLGVLSIVTDTVFDSKIKNLTVLPITMSYERVIEGETFPFELLGEEKKKESLGRLIGALNILKMSFGRVYIEFCEPINLQDYVNQHKVEAKNPEFNPFNKIKDRKAIVDKLGNEVVYRLNENLVILPTSMVASLVLLYRKGINVEALVNRIEWLKNQILQRGGRIGGIDENSSLKTINGAIEHLQHLLNQKKEVVTLQVAMKSEYKNVLMLAYYRNMLIHLFWNEALVACAISSFG
jgi:1-acyl-sn-glycerol-3-phosphate acyltransferase